MTPSHVVPQILAALEIAAKGGLRVPLVYNSSGYDDVTTLKLLEGIIARSISPDSYVNIMPQYRPCGKAAEIKAFPTPLSRKDYKRALQAAREEGIKRLDTQRRVFISW